jgi:hypothetical protein
MNYKTFGELKDQVEQELDLEEEEFVQPAEMINYFNSAIRIVESEIIKLGLREKYLQTDATVSVTQGVGDYDLPDNIVANKIRKVVYRDSVTIYTLLPLRGEEAYEVEDVMNLYNTSEYYRYMLYKTEEKSIFRIVPKAYKTVSEAIRIIYFKDLNRYTADNVICDMPDDICYEVALSYVRWRCYAKETHVNAPGEKENMGEMIQLMRETLQNQVADPDMDLVDKDLSMYEEMS